jgi:hypothetical protein
VCGKISESKGSFALLAAMHRLNQAGLKIGLVVLAHGEPDVELRFRTMAEEFGLTGCILQLPFLPHWRVPEFLRGCLAVCCLEQSFLIGFHAPIIPREVLFCGTCLVGSTEVIRKLPMHEQLPDGYGCVAIEDVNDVEALSARLAAIVANPELAAVVAARGRAFAQQRQRDAIHPSTLEAVLEAASNRRPVPSEARWRADEAVDGVDSHVSDAPLAIESAQLGLARKSSIGARPGARSVSAKRQTTASDENSPILSPKEWIELAIATAEHDADETDLLKDQDPLFRLRTKQWAIVKEDLARLVPIRSSRLRVMELDVHGSQSLDAQAENESNDAAAHSPSHIVISVCPRGTQRDPLHVDGATARILKLSDGTRTALAIAQTMASPLDGHAVANNLEWIERLFVLGLIGLHDAAVDATVAA